MPLGFNVPRENCLQMSECTYRFEKVRQCCMCGLSCQNASVVGLRLNQSQRLRPQQLKGVSVTVCRCHRCGLIFPDPLPIPAQFDDHYSLAASDYWPETYFSDDPDYFCAQLNTLELLTRRRGTALDIGAGLGKSMKAMERRGFEVFGLEPGPRFYQMAVERLGIEATRLRCDTVEHADYPAESFDFITFGAVLEHLINPGRALAKASIWLKPGGLIHLEVPHAGWLLSRLINFYYRLQGTRFVTHLSPMHSPYHLYEFTPQSFRFWSQGRGLSLRLVEVQVCEIFHFPVWLHPFLRAWMKATQSGMQLTVWLQKEKP